MMILIIITSARSAGGREAKAAEGKAGKEARPAKRVGIYFAFVRLYQSPVLGVPRLCSPEKDPKVKVMATLSRHVYDLAKQHGHVEIMESFGVQFINDTCWRMLLDAPIIPPNPKALVMTNSGKYAHYGPGLTGRGLRFGSMVQCVNAATGNTRFTSPQWLAQKRLVSLCASAMSRGRIR